MRRPMILVLGLIALVASGQEREVSIGVRLQPYAMLPVADSRVLFGLGAGGEAFILLHLPAFAVFSPGLDLGFGIAPVNVAETVKPSNVSLLRTGVGVVFAYPLGRRLIVQAEAAGGYYAAFLTDSATGAAGSFYGRAGAGVSVFLNPRFGLDLSAGYVYHNGLYQGLAFGLGSTIRISGTGGGPLPSFVVPPLLRPGAVQPGGFLKLSDAHIEPVFPILFKYYDNHPVGTVKVANVSRRPLSGVEVRLSVEQYVDNPKLSGRIERLAPGEAKTIELYALFNDRVLTITEGTKVAVRVSADYQVNESPNQDVETFTMQIYDRNALRWDDNRRVAAFVTAKDDEVQRFAKNSASLIRGERLDALPANLQLAMAMLAALKEYGLSYVVDPKSAYKDFSANKAAVDYVQFPRQTLQFKAGDCDDLSTAYCALLEAVGVPTAFITVPGHIYSAFQLGQDAKEAQQTFSNPDDLIFTKDGTVWVPVETTMLIEGFLQAWAAGARQWREHSPAQRAGFWPTAEAWSSYQPVAFSVASFQIALPDAALVRVTFQAELEQLVGREIHGNEQSLLAALQQTPDDPRARNNLGVLYARYGLEEKAQEHFGRIVTQREYAPALLNLGNLCFLRNQLQEATVYFERAVKADSQNAAVLLALARVHHAQENYGVARRYYDQLVRVDARLAERFAYLKLQGVEADRAAEASRGVHTVIWGQ